MSGDYSRRRFDPQKHYTSVLMQQGRVQLDSDWNEMAELFERRFRAERVDTFGREAVPRVGPGDANNTLAFRLSFIGGALHLGRGRMYVDGLLVENHGRVPPKGEATFDPVLDELRGADELPIAEQPYFAGLPDLPPGAPFVVYLDVWRREVTALEDPALVEPAVGVDTTTRIQTAWQLRFFSGEGFTDATDRADIEAALRAVTRPSGARLTVRTGAPQDAPDDPCILPPTGGFRSLENQLYRVEIHGGGPQAQTFFKWSRDNGAVATTVLAVGGDTLTVASLGRDDVLRFREGDWVEITDDLLEAARVPGVMAKVLATDDEERTITLDAELGKLAAARPDIAALVARGVAFPHPTPATRHTRVRRWDQKGAVVDLHRGLVPVPPPGNEFDLENGIRIRFDSEGGADFHPFDHWTFHARAADGSVDELDRSPPHGDHHHYALLGLVSPGLAISDLRVLWPPLASDGGGCCTLHVTPAQHNGGAFTIQQAIDQLRTTGGTVCLDAGVYRVQSLLTLNGGRGITIRGQGPQTVLARQVSDPIPPIPEDAGPEATPELIAAFKGLSLLQVSNTLGFALQDLVLLGSSDILPFGPAVPLVRISTCAGLVVERCTFIQTAAEKPGVGLVLRGVLAGATIRDNIFLTDRRGIVEELDTFGRELMTTDLRIEGNLFQCEVGISLTQTWVYARTTRIARNRFVGARLEALRLGGFAADTTLEIEGNHFEVDGTGVQTSASHVAIRGNTFLGRQLRGEGSDSERNVAIQAQSQGPAVPRSLVIEGNRITHFTRGIEVLSVPYDQIEIRRNHIQTLRSHAIFVDAHRDFTPDAVTYGEVTIEENRLLDIATVGDTPAYVVGIGVRNALTARIEGNTIERFCTRERWDANSVLRALSVVHCMDAYVRDNRLLDIGPSNAGTVQGEDDGEVIQVPATVEVTALHHALIFQRLEVTENHVARRDYRGMTNPVSALRIGFDRTGGPTLVFDAAGRFLNVFPERFLLNPALNSYRVAGNHLQGVLGTTVNGFGPELHLPVNVVADGPLHFDGNHVFIYAPDGAGPFAAASRVESRGMHLTANSWVLNRLIRQGDFVLHVEIVTPFPALSLGNAYTRLGSTIVSPTDLAQLSVLSAQRVF